MPPSSTRSTPVDHAQTRFGSGCSACGSIEFLYECLHCRHRYCPTHHPTEDHLCRTLALEALFNQPASGASG